MPHGAACWAGFEGCEASIWLGDAQVIWDVCIGSWLRSRHQNMSLLVQDSSLLQSGVMTQHSTVHLLLLQIKPLSSTGMQLVRNS
jgi:hypothetical protein